MAGTPSERPTALTPEQQAKLRKFWGLLLKIFAKPDSTTGNGIISDLDLETGAPGTRDDQLEQLNAALTGQTVKQLHTAFWQFIKHENPDAVVLRFLRARSWDVSKALIMMISTLCWRQKFGVEELLKEGELSATNTDDLGFIHQLRIGKAYLHGSDKQKRPVCIISPRLHRGSDQSPESIEKFTVYIMETTRLLCQEPNDTSCIIFDMTGFGLSNMDYTAVKFIIDCLQSHYPESLGSCLIHNAPWIFQGIWRIIKGWLDPVVASKIQFTNNVNDLSKFINQAQIPKFLGGKENWVYDYKEPDTNENLAITDASMDDLDEKQSVENIRKDIIAQYEKSTERWLKEESKSGIAEVKDERHKLMARLKQNYWALDKFVRARTYYDRIGVLGSRGELHL
ncbi:hypothetical protein TWF281_006872 [Arthrobotrys megalospora]